MMRDDSQIDFCFDGKRNLGIERGDLWIWKTNVNDHGCNSIRVQSPDKVVRHANA